MRTRRRFVPNHRCFIFISKNQVDRLARLNPNHYTNAMMLPLDFELLRSMHWNAVLTMVAQSDRHRYGWLKHRLGRMKHECVLAACCSPLTARRSRKQYETALVTG